MGLLKDSVEAKRFDTRVIEQNVRRGAISRKDANKNTSSLEDDAANADYVSVEEIKEQRGEEPSSSSQAEYLTPQE